MNKEKGFSKDLNELMQFPKGGYLVLFWLNQRPIIIL